MAEERLKQFWEKACELVCCEHVSVRTGRIDPSEPPWVYRGPPLDLKRGLTTSTESRRHDKRAEGVLFQRPKRPTRGR
jgi:hypothetical protein